MTMELRHLRYFLAVAEERHFTRAAARLGLSQPPLSLQIRQLEEEMEVRLFRRLARGVELTEAGHALVPHARALLESAGRAPDIARRAARGETGELRLGLSGSTPYHPAVPRLIRAFRATYPGVEIRIRETHSSELIKAIGAGELDLALVLEPLDPGELLVDRTLLAMPIMAVLPEGHRLAARRVVRLADLADEAFILVPRAIGPGWHDLVTAACRSAGFSPHVIQESSRSSSAVHFVAAGLGITVVPGWLAAMAAAGVVYLPIAPPSPKARIALVHRRDAAPALTRNFLRLARETVVGEGDVR